MTTIADKIMKRIRAKGRGKWVCTVRDFLELGGRAAVDQALSRLAKAGNLRRVGRGLSIITTRRRFAGRMASRAILTSQNKTQQPV